MWKHPLFEALATFGQAPLMTRTARRRPLSHHYRNPKDPHQAARIEAAKRKRLRKEVRIQRLAYRSAHNNFAHCDTLEDAMRSNALDPFYIAK